MTSSLPLLVVLAARAETPAYTLVDAGLDMDAPVALLVVTPGVSASAFTTMAAALENEGFDAWMVSFSPGAAWPRIDPADWASRVVLPGAVADLRSRDPRAGTLVLVGHGFGGTLGVLAIPTLDPPPVAAAFLGSPLRGAPSEVLRWLASQPGADLVVEPDPSQTWQGHPVLSLLWEEPLPRLEPMNAALARQFRGWLLDGVPLDPSKVTVPVLFTAGALDRIAPPESISSVAHDFPRGEFVRFGMLRVDPSDPGHGDLLGEPRYSAFAARWLTDHLP